VSQPAVHTAQTCCQPLETARAPISLAQLRRGETATVASSDLPEADRSLLRAMGLRDDARVMMCRGGEMCIVRVMGHCACASRIGIARTLAERVFLRAESVPAGAGGR